MHKHVTLMLLLSHLGQKSTPFSVVDAFAGDALYDLRSAEAAKTREFETGIVRIWDTADVPAGIADYLGAVRALNPSGELTHYPGSPALAQAVLRDEDRLILNELHPTAHRALAAWGRNDSRIAVHKRDAAELLAAVATPRLRRGLVLIDPAYEVKSEYETIADATARAVRVWPQGIYAIWYPVLAEARHRNLLSSLYRTLAGIDALDAVVAEIAPPAANGPARGMRGAGLVVINPPWRFCDDLGIAGEWLARHLWAPEIGRHLVCALDDYPSLAREAD